MKATQPIGPYVVESPLGQGSMGAVYRVRRAADGAPFALKVLAEGAVADEDALLRLSIEVRALAQVEGHPHVVPVVDVGATPTGHPYIVMELVEGGTLRNAMRVGLEPSRGLDLLSHVALALEHVHEQGILHRDVKPANVLLDAAGNAQLSDFGLARLVNTPDRLTRTGELLGTPAYMAPEQVEPSLGEQGPATDVYALGVILYELLCGEQPYQGSSWLQIFDSILKGRFDPPSARATGVSPALEAVCLAALEPDLSKRTPTARAFHDALQRARREVPRSGRGPSRALVAGLLLGVTLGVTAWWASGASGPPSPSASTSSPPSPPPSPPPLRPRLWLEAVARGAFQEVSASELPPVQAAFVAAWTGGRKRWEEALERVPTGERAALAWELWPLVGGPAPAAVVMSRLPTDPWARVTQGQAALRSGNVALAAVAFEFTPIEPRVHVSTLLGQARVRVAQGALSRALSRLETALKVAGDDPWLRLRCFAAGAPFARAALALGRERERARAFLAVAEREGPGVSRGLAETEVGRARGEARSGFGEVRSRLEAWIKDSVIPSDSDAGQSFVRAELVACARGLDGAAGLLLARTQRLARCAELGNDWRGAQAVLEMARTAGALRPGAPNLMRARAIARRVLHDLPEAVSAARRLESAFPNDPIALQELGLAELAVVEGAPGVASDEETWHSITRTRALQQAVSRSRLRRFDARFEGVEATLIRAHTQALVRRLPSVAEGLALALGRALRLRAQARGLAGTPPGDLPKRARATLEPLLGQINVKRLGALEQRLAIALATNNNARIVAAEAALIVEAKRIGSVSATQAEALWILCGIAPKRIAFVRVCALLLGELPARAFIWTRAAEHLKGKTAGQAIKKAKALSSLLPPARLQARRRGQGWYGSVRLLGDLVHRQPDVVPIVIRSLRGQPEVKRRAQLKTLIGRAEPSMLTILFRLGRGLLLCGSPDGPQAARDRRRAVSDLSRVITDFHPVGVAHLVRAIALTGLGSGGAITEELAYDLLCARSERPWSRAVALIRMHHAPVEELPDVSLDANALGVNAEAWPKLVPPRRRALLDKRYASARAFFGRQPLTRSGTYAARLPDFELAKLLLTGGGTKGLRGKQVAQWLRRLSDRPNLMAAARVTAGLGSKRGRAEAALRATWFAWPAGRLFESRTASLRGEGALNLGAAGEYPRFSQYHSRLLGLHSGARGQQALLNLTNDPKGFPETSVVIPFGAEEFEFSTLQLYRVQLVLARHHFRKARPRRGLLCVERALGVADDPASELEDLVHLILREERRHFRALKRSKRDTTYQVLAGILQRAQSLVPVDQRPRIRGLRCDMLLTLAGLRQGAKRRRLIDIARKMLSASLQTAEEAFRHMRVFAALGNEAEVARGAKVLQVKIRQRPGLLKDLRFVVDGDPLQPERSPAVRRVLGR